MTHCKDQEITAEYSGNINHESLKLYSSLKQCMANCEELRRALEDASETITKQTDLIEHLYGCINAGKSFTYYS